MRAAIDALPGGSLSESPLGSEAGTLADLARAPGDVDVCDADIEWVVVLAARGDPVMSSVMLSGLLATPVSAPVAAGVSRSDKAILGGCSSSGAWGEPDDCVAGG
jgi:hypothetical protein